MCGDVTQTRICPTGNCDPVIRRILGEQRFSSAYLGLNTIFCLELGLGSSACGYRIVAVIE